MIRYTVTYTGDARDQLAIAWLDSSARSDITSVSNAIDQVLAIDAPTKGEQVSEGLRRLIIPPLLVQFTVDEHDRIVTVWSVRVID